MPSDRCPHTWSSVWPGPALTCPPRAPRGGAHGRGLHAAVAARASVQLPVPAAPQHAGRPQLQRPLPVPRVPLGRRRLQQLRAGCVPQSRAFRAKNTFPLRATLWFVDRVEPVWFYYWRWPVSMPRYWMGVMGITCVLYVFSTVSEFFLILKVLTYFLKATPRRHAWDLQPVLPLLPISTMFSNTYVFTFKIAPQVTVLFFNSHENMWLPNIIAVHSRTLRKYWNTQRRK